jgi:group I intron endonuclease
MQYTVYFIENEVNHKGYVGMTSMSVRERFQEHLSAARTGGEYTISHAIRKYGEENFRAFAIEEAETEAEAGRLEQKWIRLLDTYEGQGYNETAGGENPPTCRGEKAYNASVSDERAYEILERYLMTDRETFSQTDAEQQTEATKATLSKWAMGYARPHLLERFHKKHPDYDGWTPLDGRLLNALTEFLTTASGLERTADKYNLTRGQLWHCRTGDCRPHVLERFHEENPEWDGDVPKQNTGESHPQAKLSAVEVQEIRRRYAYTSASQYDLADEYDIAQRTVSQIVTRDIWNSLPKVEQPQTTLWPR